MGYAYHINTDAGLVVIRALDRTWTAADILDSAEEIVSSEQFAPGHDWLYDLREVGRTVITPSDMRRILDRFQALRDEGRVDPESASVIVGRDADLHFTGALYQYKAGRPDDLFTAVETMEEARQWLGIDDLTEDGGAN